MKKLLFLTITCILFYNCSKNIDAKTLEGTWTYNYQENQTPFFYRLIIKNDSITLVDFFNFSLKGKFKIMENDSLIIKLNDDTLKMNLTFNHKDSTLNINNVEYQKENNKIISEYQTYELANIESKLKMNNDSLSNYIETFHLIEKEKDFKIENYSGFEQLDEIMYSLPSHYEVHGFNLFLNDEINLKELKSIFKKINLFNMFRINLISKINIHQNNYDIYTVYSHIWEDELNNLEKQFNLSKPPRIPEYANKKAFIKKFNPVTIEISSANDFDKLSEIISDRVYLVSIDVNLPMKDYLHLTQLINDIRKNKKVKIHTEILE